MKKVIILILISVKPVFCQLNSKLKFTDITVKSGIKHSFQVFEGSFGGGACVIDYDQDGWEDLYVTSGMKNDQLLRNNHDGTFTDKIIGSGLESVLQFATQGVASADVNKDGIKDLFVTTVTQKINPSKIPRAENLLFLGQKNGKFLEATDEFGLRDLKSFSTAVSFADINGDGYPDAYIGNYFKNFQGSLKQVNDANVVSSHQAAEGFLLINKNGKKFVDEYKERGLNHKGLGFGGVFTDIDNDGDQDIIVNHDFGYKINPNYLYRNEFPKDYFTEISKELNFNLKINAMATAIGDWNGDGLQDYFFSNIRFNNFLENQGNNKPFINKARELGLEIFTVSWGANFADFDNDGDLDLFVANGDLNPGWIPVPNFLFENTGKRFIEIASSLGLNDFGIARGSVVFDFDNDGDLDIFVVNQDPVALLYPNKSSTLLYRNDSPKSNWLKLKLIGIDNESFGIGCKVEIRTKGKIFVKEVDGGASSHNSQNSTILHFGLGEISKLDEIKIFWPNGNIQFLTNQKVNQLLEIRETPIPFWTTSNFKWSLIMLVISTLCWIVFKRSSKLRKAISS
jgi:hypothetical protein